MSANRVEDEPLNQKGAGIMNLPEPPQISAAKLIIAGAGLLAVLSFVAMAFVWKHQASDRKAQLTEICAATREAADNPKLDCKRSAEQIRLTGKLVDDLHDALAKQNAAVEAQGKETERWKQMASEASENGRQRAKGPERVSNSLAASARAPERSSAPCKPSAALVGAWK